MQNQQWSKDFFKKWSVNVLFSIKFLIKKSVNLVKDKCKVVGSWMHEDCFCQWLSLLFYCLIIADASSPSSTSEPVDPPAVPQLHPVLKRRLSSQGTCAETSPVPKLLPIKRRFSCQGLHEPVASPVSSSPPPAVKVKQEKAESPLEHSPCQESAKKVWEIFIEVLLDAVK